jgi:hypothetical protein
MLHHCSSLSDLLRSAIEMQSYFCVWSGAKLRTTCVRV